MDKPTYFKPTLVRRRFGAIFDHSGEEVDEVKRGLSDTCEAGGKHSYLILPYEKGQKEYLQCLKCMHYTHF